MLEKQKSYEKQTKETDELKHVLIFMTLNCNF